MFGLVVIGLGILTVVVYLRQISRSRNTMDHLNDVPDDLKRADDNERPPFDGTSGLV